MWKAVNIRWIWGDMWEGGEYLASAIGRTLNSRDACDVRPVILTERR